MNQSDVPLFLPPGTHCPQCNYEIGVPDAAACPECGLATTEILRVFARRVECRKRVAWITVACIAGPLLLGAVLRYLGGQAGGEPVALAAGLLWPIWFLMLLISFPLSFICPRLERGCWTYMWTLVLPILATPLLLIPLNVLFHSPGSGPKLWALIVLTGLSVGVANVLAWRTRRRLRHALMLRARVAAIISLLLHLLFALVIGAFAILSVIGDLIFVLPGQK